jgi:hypothetical protein
MIIRRTVKVVAYCAPPHASASGIRNPEDQRMLEFLRHFCSVGQEKFAAFLRLVNFRVQARMGINDV